MKRLISLFVILCMLIGCVPIFAEEADSGEEYYIDVELKYYTGDSLNLIILPMKTNCPEITFEIYYPDGELDHKSTLPGNFWENGAYADYTSYYHYDGDYLLVFSYEDCRTEINFTIENSDRYKAWFERTYGFKPEEKETESTEKTNTGGSSVKVGVIGVSESEIELYTGDVKEITVVSSKNVTVEVEDEGVVEAELSNGVLSIKALKTGESEIWLRTSETYTPVSVTVFYGTDPNKKTDFYSDIAMDAEYRKAIKVLSALGIMQGYDDGTFKPEATLTRAEAAAIMVRFLNLEDKAQPGETIFTDVEASHWASGYINVAAHEGIINGQGDGTFAPEEEVTYHQFVKMLVCALGYEPMAEANGGWAGWGYIFTGAKIGMTKGIEATTDENITREKAARLIYKALTIDFMEEAESSTGVHGALYKVLEGENILTEYYDYQKIGGEVKEAADGKVELTVKTTYDDEPYYAVGQVVTFAAEDKDDYNFVENTIIAYVKKTSDGEHIFLMIAE